MRENIRRGIKYHAAVGTSKLYDRNCYGYKYDENVKLVIDEDKASNVNLIFNLYITGNSVLGIIKELEKWKIILHTEKAKCCKKP